MLTPETGLVELLTTPYRKLSYYGRVLKRLERENTRIVYPKAKRYARLKPQERWLKDYIFSEQDT